MPTIFCQIVLNTRLEGSVVEKRRQYKGYSKQQQECPVEYKAIQKPPPAIIEESPRDTKVKFIIQAYGENCTPSWLVVFLIIEYPETLEKGRMDITASINM
jgi:hypothetical protein